MNIIKLIIILPICFCQLLFGDSKENSSVKNLAKALDEAPYADEISMLNESGTPYILTQTIWANPSKNTYVAVLLPKKFNKEISGINNFFVNKSYERFQNNVKVLTEKAKKLPKGLISGIDYAKDSRRRLPFVLTKISISDGKFRHSVLLNEIAYVWELRCNKSLMDSNVNDINDFLLFYINLMFENNAENVLKHFSPELKFDGDT